MRRSVARLHTTLAALGATLALTLTACIDLPAQDNEPLPSSCLENSDCDDGEICLNNQCYSDPPGGAFAVVVSPAGSDLNVASMSYPNVAIASDGNLGTFALGASVTLNGSITNHCDACQAQQPGALVTLSQRAAFIGGPPSYQALAVPTDGTGDFSFKVPAESRDLQTASLAIAPTDSGEIAWSALLPPQRISLQTPFSIFHDVAVLLSAYDRHFTGSVTLDGEPAAGFTVYLLGRFEEGRPPERISAIATTDDQGQYAAPVSVLALDDAELIVVPPTGTIAPSHRLPTVLDGMETVIAPVAVASAPSANVSVTASGYSTSGNKLFPESGRIVVEAFYASPEQDGTATFTAEAIIYGQGPMPMRLPTNADSYLVSVISTSPGELGSIYRRPITFAALGQEIALPKRTSVSGRIISANGQAVEGAAIQIEPSMGTLWNQPPELQALVRDQSVASALSAADGSFVVWVDTSWHTLGNWRLSVIPSEASATTVPRWATVIELGDALTRSIDVALPSAAVVHASATFPNGRVAEGSRVTLYRVNSINPCLVAAYPPPTCELPEVIVASGITDQDGKVLLVVPSLPPAL